MTIRPGESWGRMVQRPAGLRVVGSDGELTDALVDGSGRPTAPTGGDIARTLGDSAVAERNVLSELPLDAFAAILDDGRELMGCAHLVVRSPWWRGSWWFGPVLAVMNAEFVGHWDLAPRGHPNDGRVEVVECAASMGVQQRWRARKRLPLATHVPHPDITVRSVRSASWTFEREMDVRLDGRPVGRSRSIAVTVHPDRFTIYA